MALWFHDLPSLLSFLYFSWTFRFLSSFNLVFLYSIWILFQWVSLSGELCSEREERIFQVQELFRPSLRPLSLPWIGVAQANPSFTSCFILLPASADEVWVLRSGDTHLFSPSHSCTAADAIGLSSLPHPPRFWGPGGSFYTISLELWYICFSFAVLFAFSVFVQVSGEIQKLCHCYISWILPFLPTDADSHAKVADEELQVWIVSR